FATGPTPTVDSAELFDMSGSKVVVEAVAVFVGVPAAVAITVTFIVTDAPEAIVPTVHVMAWPAALQAPWPVLADTNGMPVGSVSSTVTPSAALGPLLVTPSA